METLHPVSLHPAALDVLVFGDMETLETLFDEGIRFGVPGQAIHAAFSIRFVLCVRDSQTTGP